MTLNSYMTNIIKTGYNLHNILYMIEIIHAAKLLQTSLIILMTLFIYNILDKFESVLNINWWKG